MNANHAQNKNKITQTLYVHEPLLVRKLGVSENMRENNKYEDTGNHQILHLIINFLKFE